MDVWKVGINHPVQALVGSFAAWKSLLLLLAVASPGPGYDTSTDLFLRDHGAAGQTPLPFIPYRIVDRLTRWDAIYFVKSASRGYVYEQEWAFSWGYTRLIAFVTAGRSK